MNKRDYEKIEYDFSKHKGFFENGKEVPPHLYRYIGLYCGWGFVSHAIFWGQWEIDRDKEYEQWLKKLKKK